jgi:hypothetical protein
MPAAECHSVLLLADRLDSDEAGVRHSNHAVELVSDCYPVVCEVAFYAIHISAELLQSLSDLLQMR